MTQSSSARGRYAVGRERRERILDIATRRFAEDGYSKVSMAGIARQAGIGATGLLHYFPSKHHLLLAVCERRFDVAAQVAQSLPADDDGFGALRIGIAVSEYFASQPGLIELYVALSAEGADASSAAHELFAARYHRVVDTLVASFQAGIDAGHLRSDLDALSLARESIAITDGVQLQYVLSRRRVDVVAQMRAYLARLAYDIAAPGTTPPSDVTGR